jgi:hypothetical protein
MANNLERYQEKLQKANEELTRAVAIMGEVQSNISKEIDILKDLGVSIPKKEDYEDELSWYNAIEATVKEFIAEKEAENKSREKEIDEIIDKWEE